ncbi:Membrane transporter [Mycena venus]|uniref:Membrane transporter n=1 Tax=Mycena venus TaxID=2733690 RepID=A0A8H7CCF1_9AGAR|nr:Membrane transporter [Mycena venus]
MASSTASIAANGSPDGAKVAPMAPEKVKKAKEDDEHIVPHNNLPIVFFSLMLTAFLAALDQTIVATALPTMVAQLGGGKDYSWVGSAYLIAGASLCPAYGKLSDIFGRKQVLYPCILIFLVGSALCGAAKSMTWLILARALQGIGGGGIQQLVQIVIGDIVSLEERGTYGSFVGAMWGVAGVIGPLVGGALTDHVSWRWCFWINLPTGGLAAVLLFFSLNLNPHHGKPLRDHVREFDFVGLFLFVGGVVCLLLGFSQSQNGWDRPATIALLVAGVMTLVLGVGFENWTDRSPVIPPRLFKTRTTGLIFLTVFFHSFAFFAAAYYLPLYFQILGASATKSGVLIIPFSLLSSFTSGLAGYIISKMGDYRPVMWIGYAVMAIGYGLMIMLDERTSLALQIIYPLIAGLGLGALFIPPLIGLQAAMPVKDMATTSTTLGLFRSLGSTIGISVGQAIWSGVLRQRLSKISGLTLNLSGAALDSARQIESIQPASVRQQVLRAYTKGVSAIWLVNTPIICVCFVAVLFLKKYSLKRRVIRTGKNGAEVVPANDIPDDLEKGPEEEASTEEEVRPSIAK